jgi:ABC-type multidrug transport system ATPase subunit/ABC-type multidrug transport system permease subunit
MQTGEYAIKVVKRSMVNTNAKEGNKAVRTDPNQDDGQKVAATHGVLLQATGLTIRTRAGVSLLSDISFHIEPGELIALTGISRSGKSTLLQSLAGLMKPESGEVLLDGINLYANLKAFRSSIGFVPAEFTLPQNITVAEIMNDGARLRLPRRTSAQDRKQRVLSLLETVGLTQLADHRIESLGRSEKRRLSIAVELISYPGILLLDESAEQLTPFDEVQITILLRELSRQGLTIIQVDQRARSAGFSDKVIFLAPGGLLAWFGPADEAFAHLRSFVPRGVGKDLFGLKEALEILANPQLQDGIEWAKRFRDHDAYQKYVDDPLHNRYPDLMLQTRPLLRLRLRSSSQEKLPPPIIPRASGFQKMILLIRRDFRLLWRQKRWLSMAVIPPLIALVDFVLSPTAASNPDLAPIIYGLMVFLVLLTTALLVQNEIFKERSVYQRETRTSSISVPYILSKVGSVGFLAIYQGLVWTIIHFAAAGRAGGLQLLPYGITLGLVALIGGILGLIASALSRTATSITNWVLALTLPQLVVSGAIVPLANLIFPFNLLSVVNPSRYALETLLAVSGYGIGSSGTPLSHWTILAIMSVVLIVLLVGIQQRAASAKV